ncbi:DUF397 domain-containing protein [Streptomyces cyaneochromogenes]|uniref:DUF397 domain-containing protein n=1 Tax=Streptomyces cyaneochromogenes TaxID=2496836 RepID=A0A3S9M5C0_9ACTN|nr:DUF397 domain-containing protein [Streptomyces cyaneochromogenes]AZQ34364.1 DUF397 domain-containing protein [Streptomyces cyaneochromogenes]
MRATPDLSATQWRKSSYSGGQQGDACVEVADGLDDLVPVRDSKTPLAPSLLFTSNAWEAFVASVKR